jgi:transcriptional regulator with XRE-family HTH domain
METINFVSSMPSLGMVIRIARIARRWEQDDLAYEAGVSQQTVSSVERDVLFGGFSFAVPHILKALEIDLPNLVDLSPEHLNILSITVHYEIRGLRSPN